MLWGNILNWLFLLVSENCSQFRYALAKHINLKFHKFNEETYLIHALHNPASVVMRSLPLKVSYIYVLMFNALLVYLKNILLNILMRTS